MRWRLLNLCPSHGVDLSSAESLAEAVRNTILEFGGIDFVVNTAAIYPVAGADGELSETQWAKTFLVNVTGNYLLADSTDWVFHDQDLPASHSAYQFRECGRAQERKRGIRHQ